jgi:metallo-beta-lactamase class B
MTWTMNATEAGKVYHVLFFSSTSILPGVPLVNNPKYPKIVKDLTESYRKLKTLPCDVFLAPHAEFFGLAQKAARLEKGENPNPFIDPIGYRNFIKEAEAKFLKQLAEEREKSGKNR